MEIWWFKQNYSTYKQTILRNCTRIPALLEFSALPALRMNGTPVWHSHLHVSTMFFAVYLLAQNLRPRLCFIYFFFGEKSWRRIERKCGKLQLTNIENLQWFHQTISLHWQTRVLLKTKVNGKQSMHNTSVENGFRDSRSATFVLVCWMHSTPWLHRYGISTNS